MPQMSPLPWLSLYFAFTVTLLICITLFFFLKAPGSAPIPQGTTGSPSPKWKW